MIMDGAKHLTKHIYSSGIFDHDAGKLTNNNVKNHILIIAYLVESFYLM